MSILRLQPEQIRFFSSYNNASVLCLVLSKAIADQLRLPSDTVSEPHDFYLEHLRESAHRALSFFNEIKVFDIEKASTYIKEFWLFRYSILYPGKLKELSIDINVESRKIFFQTFTPQCYISDCLVKYQALEYSTVSLLMYHIQHALDASGLFVSSQKL